MEYSFPLGTKEPWLNTTAGIANIEHQQTNAFRTLSENDDIIRLYAFISPRNLCLCFLGSESIFCQRIQLLFICQLGKSAYKLYLTGICGGIVLCANGISESRFRRLPEGSMIVGVTKTSRFFFWV